MSSSDFRNKNIRRPRKADCERRRRLKTQQQRLIALGVPEAEVMKMDVVKLRTLLSRPKKLAKA